MRERSGEKEKREIRRERKKRSGEKEKREIRRDRKREIGREREIRGEISKFLNWCFSAAHQ